MELEELGNHEAKMVEAVEVEEMRPKVIGVDVVRMMLPWGGALEDVTLDPARLVATMLSRSRILLHMGPVVARMPMMRRDWAILHNPWIVDQVLQ